MTYYLFRTFATVCTTKIIIMSYYKMTQIPQCLSIYNLFTFSYVLYLPINMIFLDNITVYSFTYLIFVLCLKYMHNTDKLRHQHYLKFNK